MNADDRIFPQVPVFFRISKGVTAVTSFSRPQVRLCIEVDAIDLRQRDDLGLVQTFGCTLNDRICVIVASADNDGYLL